MSSSKRGYPPAINRCPTNERPESSNRADPAEKRAAPPHNKPISQVQPPPRGACAPAPVTTHHLDAPQMGEKGAAGRQARLTETSIIPGQVWYQMLE